MGREAEAEADEVSGVELGATELVLGEDALVVNAARIVDQVVSVNVYFRLYRSMMCEQADEW